MSAEFPGLNEYVNRQRKCSHLIADTHKGAPNDANSDERCPVCAGRGVLRELVQIVNNQGKLQAAYSRLEPCPECGGRGQSQEQKINYLRRVGEEILSGGCNAA